MQWHQDPAQPQLARSRSRTLALVAALVAALPLTWSLARTGRPCQPLALRRVQAVQASLLRPAGHSALAQSAIVRQVQPSAARLGLTVSRWA